MPKYEPYMMEELLALESGLSRWELEFVEDVSHQLEATGSVSSKQENKIIELYDKHC